MEFLLGENKNKTCSYEKWMTNEVWMTKSWLFSEQIGLNRIPNPHV